MRTDPAPGTTQAASASDDASRLRLAIMRLARRLRQASPSEITPSQISALAILGRTGECSLGELAAAERVQPPTMTRIVAALADAGLVERRVDADDRRIVRIGLSPAGTDLLDRNRRLRDAYLDARIAELDTAERDLLIAALPLLERLAADTDDATPATDATPRTPTPAGDPTPRTRA